MKYRSKSKCYQNKKVKKNTKSLEKKLLTYTVACGATMVYSSNVKADVVYSGPIGLFVSNSTFPIDFDLDGNDDILIDHSNAEGAFVSAIQYNPGIGATFSLAVPFVTSQSIDAAVNFASTTYGPSTALLVQNNSTFNTLWPIGADAMLGVKFDISGNDHFGWIRLNVSPGITGVTVLDWAYDDISNAPIHAGTTGVIPEPHSLSLFALGALGIYAWRRRNKKEEQSNDSEK